MSLANAVKIRYQGAVLCCLDQTEVKAVEPYLYIKQPQMNIIKRVYHYMNRVITGRRVQLPLPECEPDTKVMFKDGTWIRIKMPFMEFINEYC